MYQVTSSKNLLIEKYSALNSQYEKSWHIVFKTVKKIYMIKPTSQIDCLRYVVTALHEMGCGTKL